MPVCEAECRHFIALRGERSLACAVPLGEDGEKAARAAVRTPNTTAAGRLPDMPSIRVTQESQSPSHSDPLQTTTPPAPPRSAAVSLVTEQQPPKRPVVFGTSRSPTGPRTGNTDHQRHVTEHRESLGSVQLEVLSHCVLSFLPQHKESGFCHYFALKYALICCIQNNI